MQGYTFFQGNMDSGVIYIYIYIYRQREREREMDMFLALLSISPLEFLFVSG